MSVSVEGTWGNLGWERGGKVLGGAEHLKVLLLGTAGICLPGRWHPGAGQWHPGKGEDEEATLVTPLLVYSCSLELQLQKKNQPKTQRMRCRQFPGQPEKHPRPGCRAGPAPKQPPAAPPLHGENGEGDWENRGDILG